MVRNLYVHFPFCRRKCSYCALHSRAGASEDVRRNYVAALTAAIEDGGRSALSELETVYFGGGSPALCDLGPLLEALAPYRAENAEFTVELHPLDVSDGLLRSLRDGGVNRISMGVQSLDDAVLADMGRGYTFVEAERAFALVKKYFDNAGIDLIVGYPDESPALTPRHARLAKWGLRHCSVYSLIFEEKSILRHRLRPEQLPSDDETLNRLSLVARFMEEIGLRRYEISNYSKPGFECRHNLAVWRGEDYFGLGEGAYGRHGRLRTQNWFSFSTSSISGPAASVAPAAETVSLESDAKERRLFRLRTREGLDTSGYPAWLPTLDKFVAEGLLTRNGAVYRLTDRGMEVCDSILAEIV